MLKNILFLVGVGLLLISCQFSENMVLHEDGSGTMYVEVDMSDMMAFGGMGMDDSTLVQVDTIIYMKRFLEENKDSIASLSKEEQLKLKKLENFNIHVRMDTETSEMIYKVSTSFKSVSEANNIFSGLELIGNLMPTKGEDSQQTNKDEDSPELIGVSYSFDDGVFKRDAYIKDAKLHQQQVDSIKQTEAFLGSTYYTLNYSFPKPINKVSNPDAKITNNNKSLTLKVLFPEYFKNPDLLDLEVELEK